MKRQFLGALGALLVVSACGNEPDASVVETALPDGISVPVGGPGRPQSLEEALSGDSAVAMWQVSDEDTVIYFVGTVHVMVPKTQWQTPKIRAAFAAADAIYLEADVFSREAQKAMGVVVTETAELDGGTPLSSFYSGEEKERLEGALATLGVQLSEIETYRPWFASMQLSIMALVNAGGDPAAGAEVMIARQAKLTDKPIRYLETAAAQLSLLASIDDERGADYLLHLLDDLEEGERYFADLLGAWFEGDEARLAYLINGAFGAEPKLYDKIIRDRNAEWALQLDRLLADEPGTFVVAVGAGHLVGSDSVQELLRGRGYEPERVY